MIKNFENFVNENETVNEGFLDNVISGIGAGIGAFKASKNAERAADEEIKNILSGSTEISDDVKMSVLVKQLVMRSAWLANKYSWEHLLEDPKNVEKMNKKINRIEEVLSKMKELLPTDFIK